MKSLTLDANLRPVRADDAGLTVFLKQRGRGYEITRTATDPTRQVFSDTAKPSSRPQTYAEFTGQGGVVVDPPPVEIIFEASFAIPAGATDYLIENRNFRNADPTKTMWALPFDGRKVIFRNCVMESAGPMFKGFRNRLEVEDCQLTILKQTQAGQADARLVDAQEVKHLIFRNNLVSAGGRGIYLTGVNNASGQKIWNGSYAGGDRITIERNRCYDFCGQYSNGAGGYIQSNWGTTHSDTAVTPSGVRGWTVANFVQLNGIPECAYYIGYNFVGATLRKARTEDIISAYGGSGGISTATPAIVEGNLLVTSGGLDWNYAEGISTSYNPSNQITTNATGYQNTSSTRYSGTGQIIGDGVRKDLWENNANYTISRNNVVLGARAYITTQGGAYDSFIDNEIYQLDKHPDGTPYTGYHEALYQWSEYEVNAAAPTRAGVSTVIWGNHTMTGNSLYKEGVGTVSALSAGSTVLKNGGTASNNFLRPGPTDGGAARIAAWEAAQTAAGRTIGRRTV